MGVRAATYVVSSRTLGQRARPFCGCQSLHRVPCLQVLTCDVRPQGDLFRALIGKRFRDLDACRHLFRVVASVRCHSRPVPGVGEVARQRAAGFSELLVGRQRFVELVDEQMK